MNYTLSDYPTLQAFLSEQPVLTLAVAVDTAGTLHAATIHYWHTTEPLAFYMVTGRDSEKCRLLKTQPEIQAACVVGTNRGAAFTVQMRGQLREASKVDLDHYYKKRGDRLKDIDDPKNICLVFTPNWVRFTDYSKGWDHAYLNVA